MNRGYADPLYGRHAATLPACEVFVTKKNKPPWRRETGSAKGAHPTPKIALGLLVCGHESVAYEAQNSLAKRYEFARIGHAEHLPNIAESDIDRRG